MEKTEDEIWAMIDKATDDKQNLSGMTYQEGIEAALRWVLGDGDEEEPIL